jgi:hypothetical protein
MALSINSIIIKFKQIATLHPNINDFGVGPKYNIQDDMTFPYFWVVNDINHSVRYTDANKYKAVEYRFILRVGDKVNDMLNVYNDRGENSNNGLEISSDTFSILMDIVNAISEDSLGLFTEIGLIDDISIEPFFHEDGGDVNGHECEVVLRIKNDGICITPLTMNTSLTGTSGTSGTAGTAGTSGTTGTSGTAGSSGSGTSGNQFVTFVTDCGANTTDVIINFGNPIWVISWTGPDVGSFFALQSSPNIIQDLPNGTYQFTITDGNTEQIVPYIKNC